MSAHPEPISIDQLVEVLYFSKTATAIHIGESAVIQFANEAMLNIWGKDRSVIGRSLEEALPELKGQPFIEMFAQVWKEGLTISGTDTPADLEVNGNIATYYFDFEYRAIKNPEGNTICILHTAVDVTERYLNREALLQAKEKEEQLHREQALNEQLATTNEELNATNEELFQNREELSALNEDLEKRIASRVKELEESEARFRTMAEATTVLISVADENSNAVYFNTAWTALTGRSVAQLIDYGWTDLIHPSDKNYWVSNYMEAFKKRETFGGEFRIRSKDGDYRWLLMTGPPRFRPDGTFAGYISSCIDITDRKRSEIDKQNLSDELASMNEELAVSNEELMSTNEELASAQEHLQHTFSRLEVNEARIRYLLAGAPIAVAVLYGRSMIVESANDKMLEIWGKTTQIIGEPFTRILTKKDAKPFVKQLEKVFSTANSQFDNELKLLLKGGQSTTERYFRFVYQPLLGPHQEVESIIITANDITEQVQARHKVEDTEAALRLAIEAANFGTWRIHSATRQFITSPRLRELYGFYATDEISIEDTLAQVTDDYREKVSKAFEYAIYNAQNYDLSYPVTGFHDGKIRWLRAIGNTRKALPGNSSLFTGVVMDISDQVIAKQAIEESEERFRLMAEGSNIMIGVFDERSNAIYFSKPWTNLTGKNTEELLGAGWADLIHEDDRNRFMRLFEQSFKNRTSLTSEFRILNHLGEYRWLMSNATARFRKDGSFEGYISSYVDITELKKDEERKNDFIGMVSHELKTPLTSLTGYIQMLQRKASKADDTFTGNALDTANRQVKKMTSMINGFLNISRLESGKIVLNKSRFLLDELVKNTVEETLHLDTSHRIVYETCGSLSIYADFDKVSNVLSNLLSNAIKYAPSENEILVKCGLVGGQAQVSVQDRGMGIEKQHLDKLFDRYYRVANDHNISGFGIGLYLSAEIIQRHQGKIWAESEIGKGSTFNFSLPLNGEE
jgi:PAS domain S-box-containing protein